MTRRVRLRASLIGFGLGTMGVTIWDIAYGDRTGALILSALAAACFLALMVVEA